MSGGGVSGAGDGGQRRAAAITVDSEVFAALQAQVTELVAQNRQLIADNATLRRENAVLREENAKLRARVSELEERLAAAERERDRYKKLYELQREENEHLKRGLIGQKSHRAPENDAQLTLEVLGLVLDDGQSADGQDLRGAATPRVHLVPAHQRRKPVRRPLPANLPRVCFEVVLPHVEREGLDAFDVIGEDVRETLERRPASVVAVQIIKRKYVRKSERGALSSDRCAASRSTFRRAAYVDFPAPGSPEIRWSVAVRAIVIAAAVPTTPPPGPEAVPTRGGGIGWKRAPSSCPGGHPFAQAGADVTVAICVCETQTRHSRRRRWRSVKFFRGKREISRSDVMNALTACYMVARCTMSRSSLRWPLLSRRPGFSASSRSARGSRQSSDISSPAS